jgi:hypothetical protein
MAIVASTANGQSAWPNYPNNSAISVTSGGSVGIGTDTPGGRLAVKGLGTGYFTPWNAYSVLDLDDGGQNSNTGLRFLTGNSTVRGILIGKGTTAMHFQRVSTDGSSFLVTDLMINDEGDVGIGTINPQYKLSVNGTVGVKEIVVTNTGWSDHVFRPDYRLRPLSEISAYIQAHRHLPDIPSEAEVREKGVSVGDMQVRLLAKIEELTLHMIEQHKEIKALRERVVQLDERGSPVGTLCREASIENAR